MTKEQKLSAFFNSNNKAIMSEFDELYSMIMGEAREFEIFYKTELFEECRVILDNFDNTIEEISKDFKMLGIFIRMCYALPKK